MPKITIDFGNGKKLMRTVNGNIATYVCTENGIVVDVLPGIYDKDNYIANLKAIHNQLAKLPSNAAKIYQPLQAYHSAAQPIEPVRKSNSDFKLASPLVVRAFKGREAGNPELQKNLLSDVSFNETERRPMIHAYLGSRGLTTPEQMKRWLYREVLHADLDDPYLGFDRILTQHYPFDDSGS